MCEVADSTKEPGASEMTCKVRRMSSLDCQVQIPHHGVQQRQDRVLVELVLPGVEPSDRGGLVGLELLADLLQERGLAGSQSPNTPITSGGWASRARRASSSAYCLRCSWSTVAGSSLCEAALQARAAT